MSNIATAHTQIDAQFIYLKQMRPMGVKLFIFGYTV